MARFLFTMWPFPGHVHPNIAVAHALRERGHEVAFYTGSAARPMVEGEGFRYFPFRNVDEALLERIVLSPDGIMGQRRRPMRLRAMWRELLVGTVPGQLADLEEAFAGWEPDAFVCDPIMWGPILVLHEKRRMPIAIFSYTAACVLPGRDAPLLGVSLPRPRNAVQRLRWNLVRVVMNVASRDAVRSANALREANGLPPLGMSVTQYTGTLPLYLMPSTREFDYNRDDLPPSVHYVGPCLWNKPADQPPPAWLDELPEGEPLVYVSEGTVPGGQPVVLKAAAEALGGKPMQVVMTIGAHRDPASLGLDRVASNIRVEPYVPLTDLLPRTDLVVTTGGSGTVLAALKEAVPLLIIPAAWDQPENAWRVAESGAGLRLGWERCTAATLGEAIDRLLNEPSFRENARRLADDIAGYGGPPRAAELLESLVSQPARQPA